MKKKSFKLISSIIVLVVVLLAFTIFFRSNYFQVQGNITVTLIDETGTVRSSQVIDISPYHNLVELLKDNYEIEGTYFFGDFFLESIDGIEPPPDYYFYVIQNGELTEVGISRIKYQDQDNITFRIMNLEGYHEYLNQ